MCKNPNLSHTSLSKSLPPHDVQDLFWDLPVVIPWRARAARDTVIVLLSVS